MADTAEPDNLEWVAVQLPSGAVRVFQRIDYMAEDDRRWWMDGRPDHPGKQVQSWPELCALGPVAYVGAFVDRQAT